MDLHNILQNLYAQKRRLNEVIKNLESLDDPTVKTFSKKPKNRRGRKEMPEAERKIVAERMRKYWAEKKKQKS